RHRIVRPGARLRRRTLPPHHLRLPRHRRTDPAAGADTMIVDRRAFLAGSALAATVPAGAAGVRADLRISTPMAPPRLAVLERRLLEANAEACEAFYRAYVDARDWLKVFARWG